jgi:hypothetical protein
MATPFVRSWDVVEGHSFRDRLLEWLQSNRRLQRARRIWIAEAARIARPVIAASRIRVRVLMFIA